MKMKLKRKMRSYDVRHQKISSGILNIDVIQREQLQGEIEKRKDRPNTSDQAT